MSIRYLINEDGSPFSTAEIQTLHSALEGLDSAGRFDYRNQNALAIAQNKSQKFLIVSGPGTGKSTLFKQKIGFWLKQSSDSKILCLTFVRKLVADLDNDIQNDQGLSAEQKNHVMVHTLHKYARSIVEKNHGTSQWRFKPHFKIVGQSWKEMLWNDVLDFSSKIDKGLYSWREYEKQLHTANFDDTGEWPSLKQIYFKLCQFYNAAGFGDLILRAKDALVESASLNEFNYFIIDEYQDFNSAEDALIKILINNPNGVLMVGDDEQILYEKLKSGIPELIRELYNDKGYSNGMLPFCGRCSYSITKSASYYIQHQRDKESISKLFLPINTTDDNPKLQVIACATPSTAVDYIDQFVKENEESIEERKTKLASGEEKDAFLLILTPAKEMNFYGDSKEIIKNIVSKYKGEDSTFSEDYYKILAYCSLAKNNQNNFTFRKVLYFEKIGNTNIHKLLENAIRRGINLCDLKSEEVSNSIRKSNDIKNILDHTGSKIEKKVENIMELISIDNPDMLKEELAKKFISDKEIDSIEYQEEEDAELEEIEVKKMSAVELMTIVGSKGLSADHVIIIGFDNTNMSRITKNAFYVAMTRARKSLHLITSLKSGGALQASDYLDQLPSEHIEFFSYKKGTHTKTLLSNNANFKSYLNRLNSVSHRH